MNKVCVLTGDRDSKCMNEEHYKVKHVLKKIKQNQVRVAG